MPTSKLPADDLFENSSMSFGEHLEELRKALVKAFIWLGIGTAAGLFFANRIVQFLETPLQEAIATFYVKQAEEKFEDANGVKPSKELAAWISEKRMMPEPVFIDPKMLAKTVQIAAENSAKAVAEDGGDASVAADDFKIHFNGSTIMFNGHCWFVS